MTPIKGKFFHLISDRYHLMELAKMYHSASPRDAIKIGKIDCELESAQYYLKSTLIALQEFEHHDD